MFPSLVGKRRRNTDERLCVFLPRIRLSFRTIRVYVSAIRVHIYKNKKYSFFRGGNRLEAMGSGSQSSLPHAKPSGFSATCKAVGWACPTWSERHHVGVVDKDENETEISQYFFGSNSYFLVQLYHFRFRILDVSYFKCKSRKRFRHF